MKKIVACVVFLLLVQLGFGQEKLWKLGIEVTPIYVIFSSSIANDLNADGTGLNYGFTIEKFFGEHFSIKSGLGRESKNLLANYIYNDDWQGVGFGEIGEINFSYVTLPILGSIHLGKRERIFIDFGTIISAISRIHYTSTEMVYGGTANADVGLVFGFGGTFSVGSNLSLDVGLRSSLGFIQTLDYYGIGCGYLHTSGGNIALKYIL